MTSLNIWLRFRQSKTIYVLCDKNVVKRIPAIVQKLETHDMNWENKDTLLSEPPIEIPFPEAIGQFLFQYIEKYVEPLEFSSIRLSDYPEIRRADTDNLDKALKLAEYLHCTLFGQVLLMLRMVKVMQEGSICEVAVLFKDSEIPSNIKKREIIEKSPVLMKAIEGENPDWNTTDIRINTPLDIPFPKAAGEFVFDNLLKYTPPAEMDFEKKPDDYPEANAKSVDELKPILELARYMECEGFMRCIEFIIEKKLNEMPVDAISEILESRS